MDYTHKHLGGIVAEAYHACGSGTLQEVVDRITEKHQNAPAEIVWAMLWAIDDYNRVIHDSD